MATHRLATQLLLLEATSPDWKLDDKTRERGRRGVAEARATLRRAGAASRGPARRKAA